MDDNLTPDDMDDAEQEPEMVSTRTGKYRLTPVEMASLTRSLSMPMRLTDTGHPLLDAENDILNYGLDLMYALRAERAAEQERRSSTSTRTTGSTTRTRTA